MKVKRLDVISNNAVAAIEKLKLVSLPTGNLKLKFNLIKNLRLWDEQIKKDWDKLAEAAQENYPVLKEINKPEDTEEIKKQRQVDQTTAITEVNKALQLMGEDEIDLPPGILALTDEQLDALPKSVTVTNNQTGVQTVIDITMEDFSSLWWMFQGLGGQVQ